MNRNQLKSLAKSKEQAGFGKSKRKAMNARRLIKGLNKRAGGPLFDFKWAKRVAIARRLGKRPSQIRLKP